MLTSIALLALSQPVTVRWLKDEVVLDNGRVKVSIDGKACNYRVGWGKEGALGAIGGEVRLSDGRLLRTSGYSQHEVARGDAKTIKDVLGSGIQVTMHHRTPGQPELRAVFWVYAHRPEVFVRLDAVSPDSISSNYMAPVVTEGSIRFPHTNPLQSLFVPYDNDNYFRYRSDAWKEAEGSYEVGAVYDDGSRHGLVVGSVDHEVWKSAVQFKRDASGEVSGLTAYAGATSKYTHDTEPHGMVSGREIHSPRLVLGLYDDWRQGMERFGDLNAKVRPALPWTGSVPFGWSSWSGHKNKLKAPHAEAATDFIAKELPWFRSGGTAYINLDSFWDNLSRPELEAFVKKAHATGLKAGIYYTPFTAWGNLTDRVGESRYTYGDIVLRGAKGEALPKVDGGYPIDPTHPGSIARVDRQLAEFVSLGFDYVKLDFMTHGALEGRHFDPKISTGTEAYAVGLQHIVDDLSPSKIGRPCYIGLSIAPMFPNGYAHSRRISCDIFANIGATEYLLNSSNYGWWTNNRLYRFNDADSSCVYQPLGEPPVSEAESRSRFTASVISGGMMLEGDDLTNPAARERVLKIYSNREMLALACKAVAFRPVDGDTGSKAGNSFVWIEPGGKTAYVAVFNFNKVEKLSKTISLARLGLLSKRRWMTDNLWTEESKDTAGNLSFEIAPTDCVLLRLTSR